MATAPAAGAATGGTSLVLTFDLDQLTIGAGVVGLNSPLQTLLAQLPAATQAALAWLPDFDLTQAQTLLNLQSGDFGAYVAVTDADGNPLASTFLFVAPASGQTQAAIGLTLDLPVDLAATPLFGPLLAGVAITGFEISYASQEFAAGSIVLPPGSPSPPAVPAAFGLTVTVEAGGAAQTFTLPSGSSDGTASVSADVQRALPPARPLASQAGGAPPVSWFAVQKSLGPLFIDRVGVVAGGGTLGLALDAALDTDVVSVQLTGFVVTFTPGSMASAPPAVSLDGLAVAVDCGALQIGGSLVRTQGQSGIEYDGSLLISIGSYAIDAVGSYAVVNGTPSLFVYGMVNVPIGGPPAFFVTGLAAGFGLNRALRLPAANELATYPLIEAAQGNGATDALAQLNSGGWVPPTPGEYWVAAGVAFLSFGIINGFALVTVEFGQDLVIALLGAAALQLPTEVDGGPVFGYIEITLEAVLRPADGILSIEALLTPNSYVIDPACQLTGGIAFDLWFGSNPHAGDFVFTAGGYNPAFPVPSWYPTVPRLGFSWNLSDALQITGQSYFALTPACVMGGGLLALTFAADGLRAWFTAQADFIMYWRPFSFDIDVNISIGVSYTGSIGFISATFTVELGVSVELWGPPLQGIAHVNWWVISFDVSINQQSGNGGSPSSTPSVLSDWNAFAASSLPAGTGGGASVCRAQSAGGLQSIVDTSTGGSVWQFGGDSLALSTETVIPATTAVIAGPVATTLPGLAANVFPLGNVADFACQHQLCIAAWIGADWQPGQALPTALDVSGWGWTTVTGNLPAALWGPRGTQTQPPLSSAVVQAVVGVTGTGQPTLTGGLTVPDGTLAVTQLTPLGLTLAPGPSGGPGPVSAGDARSQVASTINDSSVTALRAAVAAVANSSGLGTALTAGPLPLLAAEVYAVLTDPPMVGPPGTTGPPAAPSTTVLPVAPATVPPLAPGTGPASTEASPQPAPSPLLRALFRQDRPPTGTRAGRAAPARQPKTSAIVLDRWATSRDVRLATLPERGGAGSTLGPASARLLWPGMTAVWDMPAGALPILRRDAGPPLWVVAVDAAQCVVQAGIAQPAQTAWDVAPTAIRVAVTALWDYEDVRAVGWHGGTALRQVASQTLLGDGVVVRPQGPCGLPRRRSSRGRRSFRELGVTTGRRLVERTWAQHADARIRRGWVETYLPAWCQAVVVGLVPDSGSGSQADASVPRVGLRLRSASRPDQNVAPLSTDFQGSSGPRSWRFVLAEREDQAGLLVTRAAAPHGWRLDGIAGLASTAMPWTGWPREAAMTAPPRSAGPEPSRVWWE